MSVSSPSVEPTSVRRVFASWSIELPESLAEAVVDENAYWHAYDEHRSVSLTSLVLTDKRGPVKAARIMRRFPTLDGEPFKPLPPGLVGRVVTRVDDPDARGKHVISGMLATDGRVLVVTITGDDPGWVRATFLSIRLHRTR